MDNHMTEPYRFPVATRSYFRALNKDQERARFLASPDYIPKFVYPASFTVDEIARRQKKAQGDATAYQTLGCVLIGAHLQHDARYLEKFRQANVALFGEPSQSDAYGILSRLLSASTSETEEYRRYILEQVGRVEPVIGQVGPSAAVFDTLKQYFATYRHSNSVVSTDVATSIRDELVRSGLAEQGWSLECVAGNSPARVFHHLKKIRVGKKYQPRTTRAAERIAVHEVYGHALRGPRATISESEGFAILLEQLLSDTFKSRRSYRYLAASLGWGIFGAPMTFREVYEIVWRLMIIASKYSVADAKNHAFNECYRVFRGGRPDVAGAVYLKDTVYFSANAAIWKLLSDRQVSYNKFIDIIEGGVIEA
jgi:hypothetical protein